MWLRLTSAFNGKEMVVNMDKVEAFFDPEGCGVVSVNSKTRLFFAGGFGNEESDNYLDVTEPPNLIARFLDSKDLTR